MVVVFLDSDKIGDVAGTYHGTYTWQAEDRSVKVQVLILLFFHILLILAALLLIQWQNSIFPFYGFEGAVGIVGGHCWFCYSESFFWEVQRAHFSVWVHCIAKCMCEGLVESRREKDSSQWPEPTAMLGFCWPFYFKLISCTACRHLCGTVLPALHSEKLIL